MDEAAKPISPTEAVCHTVSKRTWIGHTYLCRLGGAAFFGGIAWVMGGGFSPPSVLVGAVWIAGGLFGGALLLPPLVCLHEAAHWAAFRVFGAKNAHFLWMMRNGKPVAPSVAGPGKWLWRWQYAVVVLAPTVVVSGAGVALMAAFPFWRGALAVALTLHLTGCINDWNVCRSALRLPRGTRIEDRESGFAYRTP